LTIFGTFLPLESGEIFGFYVTIELALTFLISTLDMQLAPPGPNKTAVICYVLLANNVNVVFGLLFSAYVIKANEGKHIPNWIKALGSPTKIRQLIVKLTVDTLT